MNYYFKSAKILGINNLNIFFTISKLFSLVNCFALHLKYISKTCVINWFLKCIWRHTVRTLILDNFLCMILWMIANILIQKFVLRLIEHFLICLFYRWGKLKLGAGKWVTAGNKATLGRIEGQKRRGGRGETG